MKNPESEIRNLVDDWVKGLHAKDIKRVMSHYVADIVSFDLAPPLQYTGAVALKKNFEEWFPSFQGPIGYEIRDLNISASDDIGFCRSLNRISGIRSDGEKPMSGYVQPSAVARSTASGWSPMNMSRCLSIWTGATGRRWTSSRNTGRICGV